MGSTVPPTITAAIRDAAATLEAAGIATPRLDAEVLLRHLLGLDRTQLFLRLRDPLDNAIQTEFTALIERRIAGEPVAFLIGQREFMGLPFAVGPGVLVPRPETELMVEWATAWLVNRRSATVVDVGTGSGAIALALATQRTGYDDRIVGADLSTAALGFAITNREQLGLTERVELVRGDLLTWTRGPIDLILANLPYLRPDQLASNLDLRAEPENALVSGVDGLDAIRRLLNDAPRVLATSGAIALELDPSQADTVRHLAAAALPDAHVSTLRDLAGWERVVIADRRGQ